jgi:hypothetical protein
MSFFAGTSPRSVWLLMALFLGGCVGPARTFEVYQAKAENSVAQSLSAVRTAEAAIETAIGDRSFESSVSITIQDASETIDGSQSAFASIQPPDRASDALRAQVLPVLSDASDAVANARIAARRGDVPSLAQLHQPLSEVSARLDRLLQDLL